jgi:protein-disulfide isomerase
MSFVFTPAAKPPQGAARFGKRERFLAMLVVAVLAAGALVGASLLSSSEPAARGAAAAAPTADLFAGIPQDGAALGSRTAPVTLVEYADLQCPYCAEWAGRTLPVLASDYVRSGKLRIVFRGLAFVGADSEAALRAVVAAGRQDRLWNVLHALYIRQGAENSGWASENLVTEAAESVPGMDTQQLLGDRYAPWVDRTIARDAAAADAAGVRGTPAFAIGPTGGQLDSVTLSSLRPEGLIPAIEGALAR